ncbi:u3 small nucleolar ribonucleoprotein protein [Grosmannia clavigera kw1407]|uniref:U3 small nucleolar ribonucleoprotein protein n=1 Tax=Grosmannia clavigera (strain kw1407 / UAMH 11150) TaxID=655863 RepID=F0X8C1_GROCL|nr:u3 small nucleolar ribonucleoprotein [Grosmannia clavigera kw1407]EFX05744.1 u3 small nucleolar ribonucleoprotein protein [Grosmannia clavigera kw1407]
MASPATVPEIFDSIKQSIESVSETSKKLSGLAPPAEGLSLLDVKNELLLSYLEHMVFLILLRLKSASAGTEKEADLSLENSNLGQSAVKKLVELRLYLEKGVRPLEDKLRYQIEKALRAAEASERATKAKEAAAAAAGSDDKSDEDDASEGSDEEKEAADSDVGAFNEEEVATSRPNRAAFVRPTSGLAAATAAPDSKATADAAAGGGVYRPPKIAPTMMPTTGRKDRAERRPLKSATMDEFIADEFSTAPIAQPSIGTNIAGHGRHMKTSTERQREDERRDYEERNFVRLPAVGKKDRAKRAKAEGSGPMSFGGEDWRGLGEGVDRINRLTQRKSSSGATGTRALLEKSRKRGIDTTDGPRGSGAASSGVIGERFQKRLRLQDMGRRDRGKKK